MTFLGVYLSVLGVDKHPSTPVENTPAPRGALVAFMGLPGSGKSTTAIELSRLINGAKVFSEPDDTQWPVAIQRRHEFGYFGALCWFRAMRVPLLFMADEVRRAGGVGIVDSYYDKLIAGYIGHPAMKWLIPSDDPYYTVMVQLASLDADSLPETSCLVFLRLTPPVWRHFLASRHRPMDSEAAFLQSFPTQDLFLSVSEQYAERTKTPLIVIDQAISSPAATAAHIVSQLRSRCVISTCISDNEE
jgi:hypothetical protein